MNQILVTGANGFVGRSLCEALRARGTSFIPVVRKKNHNSEIAIGDLRVDTDWGIALRGCDAVIHLAARVHVMNDTTSDPLAAFRAVNVDATLNLARQAVAAGVKRFVFVSSVKVNGEETGEHPFTAFDEAAPTDPYGQSKLEAEIALQELAQVTGLELVIVRPPLVYGPGVRANFLRLMQLVRIGLPLPLGAIKNRRSMVAVDNLVDLLILCAGHPAAAGQTFMVSDDHDVSVSELLRMLAKAMRKRSMLLPLPARVLSGAAAVLGKSAVANRLLGSLQVDIKHTKTTLQWHPPVSMDLALEKTVAAYLARS
ncbi:UDP-glucose 4-epimerase [Herminiimonas sp. KBW02]|uniref:UDP-glucose 4-epimerase family protein n=1 Tax=Herminiimonas sp. KBW02 TaxID=2153363 RepID=UPI000F5B0D6E|nr:SDR family oxidoreductase [Herminiimonas sp. KBW02]RQO36113.1 UDP-glucose 4-epimerase [Herminiimonas sp. KBW02]